MESGESRKLYGKEGPGSSEGALRVTREDLLHRKLITTMDAQLL